MSEQAKQVVAPLDLQAIKERMAKATPGPLVVLPEDDKYYTRVVQAETRNQVCEVLSKEDAEFIAHAREDGPSLIAEVERLNAEAYKQTERANIAEMELNWLWQQVQEAHDLADTDPQAAIEKLRYVMAQTEEDATDETRN